MRIALAILLLFLSGCSDKGNVVEDLPNSSAAGAARHDVSEEQMESGLTRPVTIGEDGPRLDACGALGVAVRAGDAGLPLRAAPFAEARQLDSVADGTRLHICTRSLDQRWLGVVVIPSPAPPVEGDNAAAPAPLDCGVSRPVDRKRPYDGPCASGWVAVSYVQLVAS